MVQHSEIFLQSHRGFYTAGRVPMERLETCGQLVSSSRVDFLDPSGRSVAPSLDLELLSSYELTPYHEYSTIVSNPPTSGLLLYSLITPVQSWSLPTLLILWFRSSAFCNGFQACRAGTLSRLYSLNTGPPREKALIPCLTTEHVPFINPLTLLLQSNNTTRLYPSSLPHKTRTRLSCPTSLGSSPEPCSWSDLT